MTLIDSHVADDVSEAGKRASAFADKIGGKARKIVDEIGLGHRADQVAADVSKRAARAYDVAKETVKEKPTLAIGVAATAGLLLGLMLSRR
ncbi:MAG: hypothetical protein NW200_15525 [Hyphomonadaceae bacterium]|nr:hypothetical protein [Hyphomonadaceae bacterium]